MVIGCSFGSRHDYRVCIVVYCFIVFLTTDAGQPITLSEGLALANSLIQDKPIQQTLNTFQLSKKANATGQVSNKYWKQFIKRYKNLLDVNKGVKLSSKRSEWETYQNLEKIYSLVFEQMINYGVARRLEEPDWYSVNEEGEKVVPEDERVGLKIKIEITHPQWILFGDETGTDISQKSDGFVGGQTFISQKGSIANITSSHNDGNFTTIGLTSASGEPVMCIIIFSADELSFNQRMGYDVTAKYNRKKKIIANSGPGKTFPDTPTCLFRGKTMPDLVTCTSKRCVTSDILKSAFERLNTLRVFERTPTLKPFTLFDAHDSRLQIPFLRYINNPNHLWTFCISLPNATHYWQLGDSA